MSEKTCNKCGETKILDLFAKGTRYKDGRRNICKKCHTNNMTEYFKRNPDKRRENYKQNAQNRPSWKRHGLTAEQYEEMVQKYEGKCHACQDRVGTQVDHDHNCCDKMFACGNCVRGLLCKQCNTALGLLKDDPVYVQRLLNYANVTLES
jgi:hypothetical protein